MSIKIEDLGNTDFADVIETDAEHHAPVTPGDVLRLEFMEPYELSANSLARKLQVPPNRVTAILNAQRSVTADTALRLSKLFGTTAEFWLSLQATYDLEKAKSESDLSGIDPLAA